jgi:hypothetical protein
MGPGEQSARAGERRLGRTITLVNRDKDVVVAYSGTNQTANPKIEPLPCRIIAKTFF